MAKKNKPAEKKLQVISFHSRRGGVGKSTNVLALAKQMSAKGRQVCVIDLDVIGAGLMPLLTDSAFRENLTQNTVAFLEQYMLAADTKDFDLSGLIVPYQSFSVILQLRSVNLENTKINIRVRRRAGGTPQKLLAKKSLIKLSRNLSDGFNMLISNEKCWREITVRLNALLKGLAEKGFDSVIIDCHTGVWLIAESLMRMAADRQRDWKLVWINQRPPENTDRRVA
jgi:hypothetical protein